MTSNERPGLAELKERLRNTPTALAAPDDYQIDQVVERYCFWYDRLVSEGTIRDGRLCRVGGFTLSTAEITVANMHRYIDPHTGIISYDMHGSPIMTGAV